jgi:glycosyltransferase involved in cell wall biosynthesis
VKTVYPHTIDAKEISIKYLGIPSHKIKMLYLGSDSEIFYPFKLTTEERSIKSKLGIKSDEIICIYTGRFTEDKNPLCLAKSINQLVNEGEKFKAIFIGDGPQKKYISSLKGCIIVPFKPISDLSIYYNLADIGVWPAQESTSMLDAMATGLPIIISNKIKAIERVEGNGLTYNENNYSDLVCKLLKLKSPNTRQQLGEKGRDKILKKYSWNSIAKKLNNDYSSSL